MDIGQREVQARLHDAYGPGRQDSSFKVQAAHEHGGAAVELAKNIRLGHKGIVENKFARVRAPHPELVEFGIAAESKGLSIDNKRRNACRARIQIGFGVDHINLGIWAIGDPHFIAGKAKVIAVGFGF